MSPRGASAGGVVGVRVGLGWGGGCPAGRRAWARAWDLAGRQAGAGFTLTRLDDSRPPVDSLPSSAGLCCHLVTRHARAFPVQGSEPVGCRGAGRGEGALLAASVSVWDPLLLLQS